MSLQSLQFNEQIELILKNTYVRFLLSIIILWLGYRFIKPVHNFLGVCKAWLWGYIFLLFSKDTKMPPLDYDPQTILSKDYDSRCNELIVAFVRHGESSWNEIFNRGFGPSFLLRLLNGILMELQYMLLGDSLFLDSPLSQTGFAQSVALAQFIHSLEPEKSASGNTLDLTPRQIQVRTATLRALAPTHPTHTTAPAAAQPVTFCVSNLRRAIATVAVGLGPRLDPSRDVVHVLSHMQEISRNVDTQSILPARTAPTLLVPQPPTAWGESTDRALAAFRWEHNTGNKSLGGTGRARLEAWCRWVFDNALPNGSTGTTKAQAGDHDTAQAQHTPPVVVAGGHSLWFKWFFRSYLPKATRHPARDRKIQNAGIVAFVLRRCVIGGVPRFAVDPDTITPIYLGFA